MIPTPIALGLALCDNVIVENGTEKVSLIGAFNSIRGNGLPFVPLPFCVFATLTGGQGNATLDLTITELETDEEIYSLARNLRFPHRFAEMHVLFRLTNCEFKSPGMYLFNLLIDSDWIAHRRVRVSLTDTVP